MEGNWINATETKPASLQCVLAHYLDKVGDPYIVRAFWTKHHDLLSDVAQNIEEELYEWDEAECAGYVKEGWYQVVEGTRQLFPIDYPVTHWQPLPKPPQK